jgi:hypothetical protein
MEFKVAPEKLNAPALSPSVAHQAVDFRGIGRGITIKLARLMGLSRKDFSRQARTEITTPNTPQVAAAGTDANLVKENGVVLPEGEQTSLYYRFDGL